MKLSNIILTVLISSLFIACTDSDWETDDYYTDQYEGYQEQQAVSTRQPIEMKPMVDPKTGRVVSYLPLPVDWQILSANNGGRKGIDGPNGIKVHYLASEVYCFNIDPYVAQVSGMKVANPVPLQTIFQQRVMQPYQQQGSQLIRQYPLQNIAQRNMQLLQGAMNRSRIQSCFVLASEWQKPNGQKSLVLLSQVIMHSQAGSNWSINIAELEAPSNYFEQAKETYLYAQANWQVDRNNAMAHAAELNRMDRESEARLAQSRAAHNARMRSNEAAFQAQQRTHTSTYNDISDMSMRGYWSRSDMQDRMRNKETNMIHEEYTVTNPWDNRNLQVQQGYQNYYVNSNGDIIGSNDANFNPNTHRSYNNTEWRKMNRR